MVARPPPRGCSDRVAIKTIRYVDAFAQFDECAGSFPGRPRTTTSGIADPQMRFRLRTPSINRTVAFREQRATLTGCGMTTHPLANKKRRTVRHGVASLTIECVGCPSARESLLTVEDWPPDFGARGATALLWARALLLVGNHVENQAGAQCRGPRTVLSPLVQQRDLGAGDGPNRTEGSAVSADKTDGMDPKAQDQIVDRRASCRGGDDEQEPMSDALRKTFAMAGDVMSTGPRVAPFDKLLEIQLDLVHKLFDLQVGLVKMVFEAQSDLVKTTNRALQNEAGSSLPVPASTKIDLRGSPDHHAAVATATQ